MNTDGTGFHTCKECHKTESLWYHTTTDHKEGEQLEDRRSVGASSCNSGDGTDQRVQPLMFMMMMVIKNKHLFYTNNQTHSIHTRFKTNLYPPTANLTKFQKGVYYSVIKIFNNLPHNIKDLVNEIVLFQNAVKRFLLINSIENWIDNWF